MKVAQPLLSIITVSYNSGSSIEKTIQSVIKQKKNYQYIIIDGGSVDNTLEIIKSYKKHIDFWISEKDNGIYDAMNKGLKYAHGKYVAYLNSDDYYLEGSLHEIEMFAMSNPEADVIYGDTSIIGNGILPYVYTSDFNLTLKSFWRAPVSHPSMFTKKSCLESIGGFDMTFRISGDYDAILKLYIKKYSFFHLNKIITEMTAGGVSNKNWKKGFCENLRSLKNNNALKAGILGRMLYSNLKKIIADFLMGNNLSKEILYNFLINKNKYKKSIHYKEND